MKWLAVAASLVVLAAIIAGFVAVGSPSKQRLAKFDDRKIQDLQSLQGQINYYSQVKSALPQSLSDLKTINSYEIPVDPQTKQNYEYRAKSETTYELCANFNLDSSESVMYPKSVTYPGYYGSNWTHGTGRTCFDQTLPPPQYKPIPLKE